MWSSLLVLHASLTSNLKLTGISVKTWYPDWERGGKVTGARFLFYRASVLVWTPSTTTLCWTNMKRRLYWSHHTLHSQPWFAFGTGQYPKFKEDTLNSAIPTVLIPTAEVPLDKLLPWWNLDGKDLPIYFTAMSPSFRSEAVLPVDMWFDLLAPIPQGWNDKFAKPEESTKNWKMSQRWKYT